MFLKRNYRLVDVYCLVLSMGRRAKNEKWGKILQTQGKESPLLGKLRPLQENWTNHIDNL